jgi:hypothetical protein
MFKKFSLAFLASASWLGAGLDQTRAIEAAAPFAEPTVIYADQPAQRPAPSRIAYAERSNMGGGFIEFLFGDGQPQASRALPQPSYQQQRSSRSR